MIRMPNHGPLNRNYDICNDVSVLIGGVIRLKCFSFPIWNVSCAAADFCMNSFWNVVWSVTDAYAYCEICLPINQMWAMRHTYGKVIAKHLIIFNLFELFISSARCTYRFTKISLPETPLSTADDRKPKQYSSIRTLAPTPLFGDCELNWIWIACECTGGWVKWAEWQNNNELSCLWANVCARCSRRVLICDARVQVIDAYKGLM